VVPAKSSKTGSLAASITENALTVTVSPPVASPPSAVEQPVKASTPASPATAALIVLFITYSPCSARPSVLMDNLEQITHL
jgi:hypothetical protein